MPSKPPSGFNITEHSDGDDKRSTGGSSRSGSPSEQGMQEVRARQYFYEEQRKSKRTDSMVWVGKPSDVPVLTSSQRQETSTASGSNPREGEYNLAVDNAIQGRYREKIGKNRENYENRSLNEINVSPSEALPPQYRNPEIQSQYASTFNEYETKFQKLTDLLRDASKGMDINANSIALHEKEIDRVSVIAESIGKKATAFSQAFRRYKVEGDISSHKDTLQRHKDTYNNLLKGRQQLVDDTIKALDKELTSNQSGSGPFLENYVAPADPDLPQALHVTADDPLPDPPEIIPSPLPLTSQPTWKVWGAHTGEDTGVWRVNEEVWGAHMEEDTGVWRENEGAWGSGSS